MIKLFAYIVAFFGMGVSMFVPPFFLIAARDMDLRMTPVLSFLLVFILVQGVMLYSFAKSNGMRIKRRQRQTSPEDIAQQLLQLYPEERKTRIEALKKQDLQLYKKVKYAMEQLVSKK